MLLFFFKFQKSICWLTSLLFWIERSDTRDRAEGDRHVFGPCLHQARPNAEHPARYSVPCSDDRAAEAMWQGEHCYYIVVGLVTTQSIGMPFKAQCSSSLLTGLCAATARFLRFLTISRWLSSKKSLAGHGKIYTRNCLPPRLLQVIILETLVSAACCTDQLSLN